MKSNKFSLVLFVIAVFSLLSVPGYASAEDFYFFRIDTELDVPLDTTGGVTVTWRCNGTGYGIVTDGTASESTNLRDGIVKVASLSVENNSSHAGCDGGEAITATASFSGWVNELWSGTVSAVGPNVTFTTRASMDYTILVNGVADELGGTLTLNGTIASATYSDTVASQSYSGGKRYIAASVSGGTVKGGADGYVNRISSALTVSSTASQSVDFGTTDNSTLNESGLLFGEKVTLNGRKNSGEGVSITGAIVKAGDNIATLCQDNSDGKYYCATPLSHTGTTARASSIPKGFSVDADCTYTDRTAGSSSQSTCNINAVEPAPGGIAISVSLPTPTPTPAPSLAPTPEPTPTPIVTPTPTVTPISAGPTPASRGFVDLTALNLKEGDVISATGSSDPDVYIVNPWGYKRLFLNPVIFGFYGHLGGFNKVKTTVAPIRDTLITSGLFRNCETNDEKVYGVETTGEDTGTLHWVNTTGTQAVADDPDFFKKVFCVNTKEFSWYKQSTPYTSVNQIPAYTRIINK